VDTFEYGDETKVVMTIKEVKEWEKEYLNT
jgi:hypothetical protein